MKKQVQQALRRLRKAQDGIFNGKVEADNRPCIEVSMYSANDTHRAFISAAVFCDKDDERKCDTFYFDETSSSDFIEQSLDRLSRFIGVDI